jgi:hypothetical protein
MDMNYTATTQLLKAYSINLNNFEMNYCAASVFADVANSFAADFLHEPSSGSKFFICFVDKQQQFPPHHTH